MAPDACCGGESLYTRNVSVSVSSICQIRQTPVKPKTNKQTNKRSVKISTSVRRADSHSYKINHAVFIYFKLRLSFRNQGINSGFFNYLEDKHPYRTMAKYPVPCVKLNASFFQFCVSPEEFKNRPLSLGRGRTNCANLLLLYGQIHDDSHAKVADTQIRF